MALNPAELGFFERRPDSGIWYRSPKRGATSYEPRVCANPDCPLPGGEFMGSRQKGRGQFCSNECKQRARRKPDARYHTLHQRVRRARGSASDQTCVDCGQAAAEWSQIQGTTGQEPEHYEPRCEGCHTAYDTESHMRGEDSPNAQLSEARVRGIKASVGATQRELAEIHGVSRKTIHNVLNGKAWRHI